MVDNSLKSEPVCFGQPSTKGVCCVFGTKAAVNLGVATQVNTASDALGLGSTASSFLNSVLVMELQKPVSVAKLFTTTVWGCNPQFKKSSPKRLLELAGRMSRLWSSPAGCW